MLKEGMSYKSRMTVTDAVTAEAIGSGDMPVLATPMMMALMENAAMLAVKSSLEDGCTTVGGHIDSSHLKPSPLGAEVEAEATLTKIDGRRLYFHVVARQNGEVIGEGEHLRFVVNRSKFMAKLF